MLEHGIDVSIGDQIMAIGTWNMGCALHPPQEATS
jgi:hypothetical protein